MRLNSLSISSSKTNKGKKINNFIKTGIWVVVFLILFDVAINLLFPYPKNPRNTNPGQLNLYFDYGRSIEGKVLRQIGPTEEKSAPIALAGWLQPEKWEKLPTVPDPGDNLLVATYGMSFSKHISEAMEKLDSSITFRLIAGPTAPPNYVFAAYNLDRDKQQANVVMLGILASSVRGLTAISGMNLGSEVPPPFTFPRYYVKEGKMESIWPEITSFPELSSAVKNKQQWQDFVNQMAAHDDFFDNFLFRKNWLDSSALLRLIRRSVSQSHDAKITSQIHTKSGFNQNWEGIEVLKKIVQEFATTAKSDGKLPIVLLIQDQGYDDHLYQILKPTLEGASIPFVSTHNLAPTSNRKNFVGDGHFTDKANEKIAQEVLAVIKQNSVAR